MTKLRRMKWTGRVARMVNSRGAYTASVWRTEGQRPFGRSKCRWEDIIKMELQEVKWEAGMNYCGSG